MENLFKSYYSPKYLIVSVNNVNCNKKVTFLVFQENSIPYQIIWSHAHELKEKQLWAGLLLNGTKYEASYTWKCIVPNKFNIIECFPVKVSWKKKKKPFASFFCETSFYEACAIQNVLNLLPIGLLAKIFSSSIYVLTFVMITLILLYESLRSKDGNNRCWKLCLNWTENNQWTLLKRSMLLINNLPAYLSHYGS